MMQKIVTQFPWLSLSSVALLIFFVFFVTLIAIVNLKSQAPIHRLAARLPLDEADLLRETENADA